MGWGHKPCTVCLVKLGHIITEGSGGGRLTQEGRDSLDGQPSHSAQAQGIPRMWDFQCLNQESPGKTKMSWSHLGLWVMGRREGKLWVRMVYYNPLRGAGRQSHHSRELSRGGKTMVPCGHCGSPCPNEHLGVAKSASCIFYLGRQIFFPLWASASSGIKDPIRP